ncbi:hypothetical protein [Pseudomonas sp. ANT_J12]|uniref:hypothetical protein n=1 Tax=Pseudomonas sp. ANT_J12 TaxID=2597351 RepID=UPI001C49BB7D|nr:hypothetical protein [Pseudomonas sp. ANT_J12]
MTLKSKLDTFKADFDAGKPPYNVPHSGIEVMQRATAELRASGVADKAQKMGDKAPVFMLSDPHGVEVNSAIFSKKRSLVRCSRNNFSVVLATLPLSQTVQ